MKILMVYVQIKYSKSIFKDLVIVSKDYMLYLNDNIFFSIDDLFVLL